MNFIKITTQIALVSLFVTSIILFGIGFGEDNNASIILSDDPDFSGTQTNLESNLDDFYVSTNTSASAFSRSTVSSQTEASEGGTQFKVTEEGTMSKLRRTLNLIRKKVFGGEEFSIVFTTFLGIFGFILFALAYKAWVGRNPG